MTSSTAMYKQVGSICSMDNCSLTFCSFSRGVSNMLKSLAIKVTN